VKSPKRERAMLVGDHGGDELVVVAFAADRAGARLLVGGRGEGGGGPVF
jgi:hypothetical protein